MLLDDVMLMAGGEGEAGGAALVLTVLVGAGRTDQHNKTADQQPEQPRVLQDSEGSVTNWVSKDSREKTAKRWS